MVTAECTAICKAGRTLAIGWRRTSDGTGPNGIWEVLRIDGRSADLSNHILGSGIVKNVQTEKIGRCGRCLRSQTRVCDLSVLTQGDLSPQED